MPFIILVKHIASVLSSTIAVINRASIGSNNVYSSSTIEIVSVVRVSIILIVENSLKSNNNFDISSNLEVNIGYDLGDMVVYLSTRTPTVKS